MTFDRARARAIADPYIDDVCFTVNRGHQTYLPFFFTIIILIDTDRVNPQSFYAPLAQTSQSTVQVLCHLKAVMLIHRDRPGPRVRAPAV